MAIFLFGQRHGYALALCKAPILPSPIGVCSVIRSRHAAHHAGSLPIYAPVILMPRHFTFSACYPLLPHPCTFNPFAANSTPTIQHIKITGTSLHRILSRSYHILDPSSFPDILRSRFSNLTCRRRCNLRCYHVYITSMRRCGRVCLVLHSHFPSYPWFIVILCFFEERVDVRARLPAPTM